MVLMRLFLHVIVGLIAGSLVQAQTHKGIPGWRYLPLQESFMRSVEEALARGRESDIVKLALEQRDQRKGTSEEGEARMVLAQLCQRQGLFYCTYHFSLATAQDFPGSMPALWGLTLLEQIVRERAIVEKDITRLMNSGSFKEIPENLKPMAAFYVALDNLNRGLAPWAAEPLKSLGEGNFWSLRWRYLQALEATRRISAAEGSKRLTLLSEQATAEPHLQSLMRWQLARLKFEQADYEGALQLYLQVPEAGRSGGRVLFERAWTHYYRGAYAEVLGLLHSLKAPYYAQALDPEQYLLEMLTLRRLCHVESVKAPAAEFRQRYQNAIEHIRKRLPLSDHVDLVRLSFAKSSLEPGVETVGLIRLEKDLLKRSRLPAAFISELDGIYTKAEKEIRQDVELAVKPDLPVQAKKLLEMADQIQLVEYLSGLDAFRIEKGYDKRDYEAPVASSSDFQILFWPVKYREYWSDEFKNYRVLVGDRCSKGNSK